MNTTSLGLFRVSFKNDEQIFANIFFSFNLVSYEPALLLQPSALMLLLQPSAIIRTAT